MNFKPCILVLFFFCFFLRIAAAQTGSWNPADADLSFPRTLLDATQVPEVQESIASGVRFSIYSGLYSNTNSKPPVTNTTSGERRARATFAKNAAFVVLMNRKPAAGTLVSLTEAERVNLVNKVIGLLENINTNVEAFASFSNLSSYTEWQWRSKELIDYMVAYDLLRGAGESAASLETSRTMLQTFAGNLYRQSVTPFFGVSFYNQVKNNHTLMTAAALGLSAVVLNDVGGTDAWLQPANWINTGMYHIDNVLWRDANRQSDPTTIAGYAEGPYYFKYAFLNCLPFIRTMGNFLPNDSRTYTVSSASRSIRNPYHDPAYDLLYEWISAIQMPDGRFPALEDSFIDMGMPELALTGKSRFVHTLALSNLATNQLNSFTEQLRNLTVDMRAAFLAANIPVTQPANEVLTSLPASGNLVFRSGNDTLANYLHLYGKNGRAQSVSGGHNQGDASSFILHAKGQLLALDPGYLSSTRRGEVGGGVNHNMVLVDGAGPAMGTAGSTNDAEAFIQNTFSDENLHYGEVRTSYRNASITRKTLFIRNSYFLMADFASSATPHTFTWQLHGYGLEGGTSTTGTFTDSLATHTGTWQKNGVNLKAHVTATGGATAYGKATNPHEVTYNTSENHTTLQVQKENVSQTQFLSLLYPYTTTAAAVATASTPEAAALAATEAGYKDFAFAQADNSTVTVTSFQKPLTSDALLTFYSLDPAGNFAQAFLEQGTNLKYGARQIIQSSERATISWQKIDDKVFSGYSSKATTLTVPLESAPSEVRGNNIRSYSYNAATQQLQVIFNGPSDFTIEAATALPVLPATQKIKALTVSPVPADEYVTFTFSGSEKDVYIKLLNANGQLMQRLVFRKHMKFNTSQLAPGVYFIQAFDAAGQPVSETRNLVIWH